MRETSHAAASLFPPPPAGLSRSARRPPLGITPKKDDSLRVEMLDDQIDNLVKLLLGDHANLRLSLIERKCKPLPNSPPRAQTAPAACRRRGWACR